MENLEEIITSIKKNELASISLEVGASERESLLESVNSYTEEFLNTLPQQKAYEIEGYAKEENDEAFEIKDETLAIQNVLKFVGQRVDRTGLNPASGGHFGYIPGGGIYTAALGDYMAAITNRYAGVFYASPGAVRVENALINWVGKLIGYKDNFGGNLTSGGSLANLIAISTARTAKNLKAKDVENSVIYVCQQAHHSILKALKITGLEECIIRIIDLDDHYRMQTKMLEDQLGKDLQAGLRPFLLIGNAGSTDVGAVDPLFEMATIAKKHGIWFHVDAAYGGFFLLNEQERQKMSGIELADSVIMDPHKGLFIPYGLGMVIVKNVHHLFEANNYEANYMQDTKTHAQEYSPAQLSPELSKHFRGLRMWLPLKLHGVAPFAAALEEKLLLTKYFYEKVKDLGFETGPYPDLSIVLFWYVPRDGEANMFNKKLMEEIQKDGRIFISSTMLKGKFLLRFVALSFRTHQEHVDLLLSQLKEFIKSSGK